MNTQIASATSTVTKEAFRNGEMQGHNFQNWLVKLPSKKLHRRM